MYIAYGPSREVYLGEQKETNLDKRYASTYEDLPLQMREAYRKHNVIRKI